MSSLASALSDGKLAGRVFDERQLAAAIDGGAARRYALVNRALKNGSLVRLKRGTYFLNKPYRSDAIHPFTVAQALLPGSYVSFETALAHHGWENATKEIIQEIALYALWRADFFDVALF